MDRQQKIELLKGIAAGKVNPDVLKAPFRPSVDEILRVKQIAADEKEWLPISEADQQLLAIFNEQLPRLDIDHLPFEDLYLLKYGIKPPSTKIFVGS